MNHPELKGLMLISKSPWIICQNRLLARDFKLEYLVFGIKLKTTPPATNSGLKLATRQQLLAAITKYLVEQLKQYKVDPQILWADRANITLDTLKLKTNFAVDVEQIQQHLAGQISRKVIVVDVPMFAAQDYWYIYSLINVGLQQAVLEYLNYSAVSEAII